jgi:hypothetical protein
MELDASVYPDSDPPTRLRSLEEKADYLQRICGAFDHGLVPEKATIELFSDWKEVFDRFPLNASPGYHALRAYFGWEPVERLPYLGDPAYVKLDRIEGREDDCEERM